MTEPPPQERPEQAESPERAEGTQPMASQSSSQGYAEKTEPTADLPDPSPMTQPDLTKPHLTKPQTAQPHLTEPQMAQPDLTKPQTAQPYLTEPQMTQPHPGVPLMSTHPGGPPPLHFAPHAPMMSAPGGPPPHQGPPPWSGGHPSRSDTSGYTRAVRFLVFGLVAVMLSLCSGLLGGFLIYTMKDSDETSATVHSGPVLNRGDIPSVASAVAPSVVDINTGQGGGSGVIISADGAILTNNHVVASAKDKTVVVNFSNGKRAQATIMGTDPAGDIAVVKVQGISDLTPAKFGDSNSLRIGDTVLALGSPLGLQGSVTQGIISALNRTISAEDSPEGARSISDVIQTDAAINRGNSGGPLVNLSGEVIGINTAIATSGPDQGSIGLGFAIPSNKAKSAADQILSGKKVVHPYLGVMVTTASDGGALVSKVEPNSPADKAGLQQGDVIIKINDRVVTNGNSLVAAVQAGKPGDQITITVKRDSSERQFSATLGST